MSRLSLITLSPPVMPEAGAPVQAIKVLLFAVAIRSISGSVNRIGSLPTAKTKAGQPVRDR